METPETIMKTWMRRVWNELDVAAADELLAPDAVVHGLGAEPIRGRDGWKQFQAQFLGAFSGFNLQITGQVVSGDTVAARFEGSMTHKVTGKPVTVNGMVMCRVRDGQLVEGWNAVDFLPMLTALGSVPVDAFSRAMV